MTTGAPADPLHLEGFRVRMYRAIRDSGFVPVYPLTALVGRLLSGKSSLLRALSGIAPAWRNPYSLELDWPRDGRRALSSEHIVCAAVFRLAESAREELERAGLIGAETRGIHLGRDYAGGFLAEEWRAPSSAEGITDDYRFETRSSELRDYVLAHLPTILFAEPDSQLPDRIALARFGAPDERSEPDGLAALTRLAARAGLDLTQDVEAVSDSAVRAAAGGLRAQLEQCGLATELELELERNAGQPRLRITSGPERKALSQLAREARLRLTLDLRVAAARLDGPAPILLLDGPGRVFNRKQRPRLQALLQRYVPASAAVLYTARLPFDIDLQFPEQVLVLSPVPAGRQVRNAHGDAQVELSVRAALGMTGRASFRIDDLNLIVEGQSDLRILHALDELLRRSGEAGLPNDVNLASAGGSHEVAAISAFLGVQGLGVLALVDSDLAGVTADSELEQAIHEDPRLERVESLQLAHAAGLGVLNATIEDLFPAGFYLRVAREVCEPRALPAIERAAASFEAAPPDTDRNLVSRLSRSFETSGTHFPKARVARALVARLTRMQTVASLPPGMLPPARRLMKTIRDAAARVRVSLPQAEPGDAGGS